MKITIAGAGSIGCYCGALLAQSGHDVILLGRPRILDQIREHGLTVTDFTGLHKNISDVTLTEDPSCLAHSDVVIVAVKTAATPEMAGLIAKHAPKSACILSFQNGMENARLLRESLPDYDVRAAMVPFNVVPTAPGTFHRASSGDIVIQSGPADVAQALSGPELTVIESETIEAVQWGKLLINLNNALNALSGLTLTNQLLDRGWRRLMADQMSEALAVLQAAQKPVASTTPLPVWMTPHILRLPTPVFTRIAARMLTIDANARASMAYDLDAGRSTEIDSLQGEIIRLAKTVGRATPICKIVRQLILGQPDQPMTPQRIRGLLKRGQNPEDDR